MRATPAPMVPDITELAPDELAPAVRPDAAAYEAIDAAHRGGVVLCHGFTGSPKSMRPWAEHLERAGYSVSLPLLPGHGTSWEDMNTHPWQAWFATVEDAYADLRKVHDKVFVAGLSMGGGLALRLAELHADVAGVMLVNPAVAGTDLRLRALPLISRLIPSQAGISNDIAKRAEDPSIDEGAYDRTPLKAASAMVQGLWPRVRADLSRVNQPLLYFRSRTDHVVDGSSMPAILNGVASRDVTVRMLARSYHVATLDYDADAIFRESVEWLAER